MTFNEPITKKKKIQKIGSPNDDNTKNGRDFIEEAFYSQ